MPIRRSKQPWAKLIQAFEGSGLSHEEFAGSVGVSVWTFRGWLNGYREQGIESDLREPLFPRFVKVGHRN